MKKYVLLGLRITVAAILIQTLRYKLTGHPDSVYIFTKVGLEPHGRISVGIIELIAGILLLIPRIVWLGALLTVAIIGGAVFLHLTVIGVEVNGDHGMLFYTALFTLVSSLILSWAYRKDIPIAGRNL